MKTINGSINAGGLKIGIVASRFNELIVERLVEGALDVWRKCGGNTDNLTIARVPGAFELPIVANALAKIGDYDAIVCLGCVIRGATSHYDHVCAGVTSGVMNVGLTTGVPVIFGVITTENLEQAMERAGSKAGNKGADAMFAAIETADVLRQAGGEKR